MSIEVRVPKEITEYKEKILFGLSIRQLLSSSVAIVLGLVAYFLTYKKYGQQTASYIVMIVVVPVFAFGFKIKGFTFEKYLGMMIRHFFGVKKRPYKTELLIDDIVNLNQKDKTKNVKRSANDVSKKESRQRSEYEVFEITAKERKRKCKEANRKIKAARQEYNRKK